MAEVTVVDAGGRSVRVSDASRILSIGGDVTEIVYALGAGDRVVGVDTTSQFRQALKEKKSVGYMRALSSEGVISVAGGFSDRVGVGEQPMGEEALLRWSHARSTGCRSGE